MNTRLSPAQERGLILLMGLALLASGALLLLRMEPAHPGPSGLAVTLDNNSIRLPRFIEVAPVDVNTATADALISLPGIGPALAQRILDFRAANGPFGSIEELAKVSGIGLQTVAGLKGLAVAGVHDGGNQ